MGEQLAQFATDSLAIVAARLTKRVYPARAKTGILAWGRALQEVIVEVVEGVW